MKRLDLLFYQLLAKISKILATAATQLQNNYATKLSLSDLNLTLKILPANLTLCFFGYPFQYHSKTIYLRLGDYSDTSTVENNLSTFELKP